MTNLQKILKIRDELIALRSKSDDGPEQYSSLVSANQYLPLFRASAEFLPSSGSALDWGCGNGHFSYLLWRLGWRVTAFSFETRPAIMPADERFKFVAGNLAEPIKLPFSDETFGLAASVGVLEHVRETQGDELESLKELFRVLVPGGIFLCAHLPNRSSWIEFLTRRVAKDRFAHPYRYTKAEIENFWTTAGFKILRIERYGWLPRNLFKHLPLANLSIVARLYDWLEAFVSLPGHFFNQNFLIIASKPVR